MLHRLGNRINTLVKLGARRPETLPIPRRSVEGRADPMIFAAGALDETFEPAGDRPGHPQDMYMGPSGGILDLVEGVLSEAAQAAGNRAVQCHARLAQLAAGQRIVPADVDRARVALLAAGRRASRAQRRLAVQRRLHQADPEPTSEPFSGVVAVRTPDLDRLRRQALELPQAALHVDYLGLGGVCSLFELDAFLHGALELPRLEITILAQAVWEMVEF